MGEMELSAVILAGGKASRYGGIPKSFIQIKGQTIIAHNIQVLSAVFSEIFIISNEPEIFSFENDVLIYPDLIPGHGPLSGIHSALSRISNSAAFIFACDMPNLRQDVIESQLAFYERNPGLIIIPNTETGIEPLHGIYPKAAFTDVERLLKIYDNPKIRLLFSQYPTLFMRFDDSALARRVFFNINNPDDLSSLLI
ncbi:MAG: molybdenum cofactor guanylyltransferase [Bacteroidia bacterium]|nr:molybdenum cofactor guanylyltransferase [Bacteroidales bacterium]NCD42004.1 molybdenum cofactor guanylyltransferase [Bacteroidia bacterium]MDD3011725.1 molybdenum cofactor guanylyltransferase [Bacteroidales bacterium]MDD3961796.1 molybdenum cofactor guanylyltransferase [Bacteroidales bacterium]MDY0285105.1 molybdenum cofactor guanylyltransferase [Bacteroidales bacterium]